MTTKTGTFTTTIDGQEIEVDVWWDQTSPRVPEFPHDDGYELRAIDCVPGVTKEQEERIWQEALKNYDCAG